MKKGFILLYIFLAGHVYAQEADTVVVVNKETLELMQLLHPDFFYSPDTAVLDANMQKFLLQDIALCASAQKEAESRAGAKERYEHFIKLASVYFWATEIRRQQVSREPGEEECKAFYETHKDRFRTPYVFTFYQAWTPAGTEPSGDTDGELQRRIRLWKQGQPDLSKAMLGNTALNLEEEQEMSPDNDLYQALLNAPLMQVTGHRTAGGHTVQLVLLGRKGGEVKPYEAVRDQCMNGIRSRQQAGETSGGNSKITYINQVK